MDSWTDIRRIPCDTTPLLSVLTPQEREYASHITSSRRQSEWITWRALVRERLGAATSISYDGSGAPVLGKGEGHISVSHTEGFVAVVWSAKPCAIDIERSDRNVCRLASRFISEAEYSLSDSSNPLFPVSVWCAKETLYKYHRVPGIDFLESIRITGSDLASGVMTGRLKENGELTVRLSFPDGLVCAVIT